VGIGDSAAVHVCPGVNFVTVHDFGELSVTDCEPDGLLMTPGGQMSETDTAVAASGMKSLLMVTVAEFTMLKTGHVPVTNGATHVPSSVVEMIPSGPGEL